MSTRPSGHSWADRGAAVALALWGAIHVAGGVSLLVAPTTDGLDTLAPAASTTAPATPGDAAEALLRFHALNIGLGGLAVLVLVAWWARSRVDWRRDVALAIAVALDIGLLVFLVGPGLLPVSQGLVGPALALTATVAVVSSRSTAVELPAGPHHAGTAAVGTPLPPAPRPTRKDIRR